MFSALIKWFTPQQWIGMAVAVALVAGAGAWFSYKWTSGYYVPQVEAAQAQAKANQANYERVAAIAADQSAAVQALKAEGDKRAQQAAQALAKVRAESDARRKSIASLRAILSAPVPLTCNEAVDAAKDAL